MLFYVLPFRHLIINPKGNNGSMRQSSLEGLGIKLTSKGAYAMNKPSGERIFDSSILSIQPANRFAPAESPANTILLPSNAKIIYIKV